MSFVEVEFAYFLPGVLLLYWVAYRSVTIQNAVLLGASYVFYASWHWQPLFLLIAGTLLDFLVARYLGRNASDVAPFRRRLALAASLAFSLGALAFFKYEDFFAAQANVLLRSLGLEATIPALQWMLPLGISFYTLQRIGYILDVYWQRQVPSPSLLQFATFCAFFPQITAGPISRGSELLPQLERSRSPDADQWGTGTVEFLLGYALKAWAATILGTVAVDPVFADPAAYTVLSHWIAVTGYALQVFADFAGYSLMAIGVARLFGIDLPMNFNFPFFSKSLPELWRRWHISLNRWLFDYIFTPLTTSTGWFRGRLDTALMLTFLASGLWHGANWTFIAWGAMHGIGMIAHRHWDEFYKSLCRRDRSYVKRRQTATYGIAATIATVGFFVLTMVPFRAPDMSTALLFARGMIASSGDKAVHVGGGLVLVVMFIVAYHLVQLCPFKSFRDGFFAAPAPVRGICYGASIAFLMIFTPVGSGTFIYQQF
jgi:D-alanyl-lipoteichoic acid acyltransferase DltB (MBOAT superfamily)